MDEQQREAFEAAVERKKAEAEQRSQSNAVQRGGPPPDDPASQAIEDGSAKISDDSQVQDAFSVRDKNSRHGKVTADKWNQ